MDYFNYNMRQYSPATESLSLIDLETNLRRSYDGKLYYKAGQNSNDFVDLKAIVDNVTYLQNKVDNPNTHPQFQVTIDNMAQVINKLSEENYELQQRLDKLEMLIGEN